MTSGAGTAPATNNGAAAPPMHAGAGSTGAPLPVAGGSQLGLDSPVGVGKTEDMLAVVEATLRADPNATCVYFVPNHSLANDVAPRLEKKVGPHVTVGVWRGLSQPDPNAPAGSDVRMCRRHTDAADLFDAGGAVADLCGSAGKGFCRYHPDHPAAVSADACAYVDQGRVKNRVMVMTHAMLFRPAPDIMRRHGKDSAGNRVELPPADLVVIDESFWPAAIGGGGPEPYTVGLPDLASPVFASVPSAVNSLIGSASATAQLGAVRQALHAIIAQAAHGALLSRAVLTAAGLTAHALHDASRNALQCKRPIGVGLPACADGGLLSALGTTAPENSTIMRVAKLLHVAAGIIDGRLGPAALRVRVDKAGIPSVAIRWRNALHPHWLAAGRIIHADATMVPGLARAWLSNLSMVPSAPVAMPHVRVLQISDRALGVSKIVKGAGQTADEERRATENADDLWHVISTLAARYAGQGGQGGPDVLVIMPKALEAYFGRRGARPLPANVGTLHFGKLRGQDAFRAVAALVIISRLLPGPDAVEDMAEISFGRAVARLPRGSWYPGRTGRREMADGTAIQAERVRYHPDPDVESIRWALCEAELIQAIGRGRGVRRTSADPLDVFLLTNVPLPNVRVSEVCTMQEVVDVLSGRDPVMGLVKAGVLPGDWPGIGVAMASMGFLPRARGWGAAARMHFSRRAPLGARLHQARQEVGGIAPVRTANIRGYRDPLLSYPRMFAVQPPPWMPFSYRRAGARTGATVLVNPRHSDPQAAVEKLLGPLSMFAPVPPAPRPALPASTAPAVLAAPEAEPPAGCGPAPAPSAPTDPDTADLNRAHANRARLPSPLAPVFAPAAPPSPPAMAPHAAPDAAPDADAHAPTSTAWEAKVATIAVGLPPVLDALVRRGALQPEARRRHLDRFRMDRGSHLDREHRALGRIAQEVGLDILTAATRAAALAKLRRPDSGGSHPR